MKPIEDRFWAKVEKTDTCWVWTGSLGYYGYGKIGACRSDPDILAHRLSWTIHNGAIPEGLCVLHHCDNRGCVRPDHLFLGTKADNTKDMIAKGRMAVGERLPQSKLTEADVVEIRRLAQSMTCEAIARQYSVRANAISRIVARKRWSHVR